MTLLHTFERIQFVHVRFVDGTERVDEVATDLDGPNAGYYHAKALERRRDVDAAWVGLGPARKRSLAT